jgi:DNA-binding Lrp family transcriptional regulator
VNWSVSPPVWTFTSWEQVDFVWQVSGSEDIVLVVDAADTGSLNALITRARDLEEVVSTETRLILDEQIA